MHPIHVNARFLTQPRSGVQRYAEELLSALDGRLASDPDLAARIGPVTAWRPAGPARDPGWRAISLNALPGGRGHLWEQGALWRATRRGVLLGLGNSGPLAHRRQVLALHDTHLWDMPGAYTVRYRAWHRMLRPALAARAAALLAVSDHAATALAARLRVPRDRFVLVPNAAGHLRRVAPDPDALDRAGLTRGRYLLAVGNRSPNKNLVRLLAAHGLAGDVPPLVIVGGRVPGIATSHLPGGRALSLGRVDDATLRALYEHATGLVFPSLHEGFGIPPLEAMSLDCPVAAARSGALPEVLGAAPIWFDPLDAKSMAGSLRALTALTTAERTRHVRLGRARAAAYDWDSSAATLVEILLSLRAPRPARATATRPRTAGGAHADGAA